MYNYVMLVGRIANDIEIKVFDDGKKVLSIVIAVNRPFKNSDGKYDVEYFRVSLWDQIASLTNEFCKKGALVGIKGHLSTSKETLSSGSIVNMIEIYGDKILFLSPKDSKELGI